MHVIAFSGAWICHPGCAKFCLPSCKASCCAGQARDYHPDLMPLIEAYQANIEKENVEEAPKERSMPCGPMCAPKCAPLCNQGN